MPHTILCADDDRDFLRIISGALEKEGYRVETARDGESALERIANLDPDLAILDVMLPRRDGFSVLAEIRRQGSRQARLPVLLLAGFTVSPDYAKRARQLGADEVLKKPMPLDALVRLVGAKIAGRRPPSSDAKKGFRGSFQDVSFPALLHRLHGMRASGVLQVQGGKKKKQIQIHDGTPVAVKSNLVGETLGHLLVASGTITWDALHESLRRVKRGEGMQGQILKAMHMLDEEALAAALRNQALEKLLEVFTWRKGLFAFHPGARIRDANRLMLKGSTASLVLDGVLWRTRIQVVDAFIAANAEAHPAPNEKPFYRFQDAPLDEEANAWLTRFDGRLPLGAVASAEEPVRRAVYAMLSLEILDLGGPARPAEVTSEARQHRARPRPIQEIRRNVQEGEARASRGPDPEEGIRAELAAMAERFRGLDYFGVLGLREEASEEEIRHSYTDLAKRTHPDRFAGSTEAVIRLAEEVFGLVSIAYETLGERDSRLTYIRDQRGREREAAELEEGHRALRAELAFQKGEAALRVRNIPEALERFKEAMDLYPEEGEYQVYYGWALYLEGPEVPGRLRQALEHVLSGRKLAPDRQKAYLFLGRLYNADGRTKIAEKMFTRAVQMNPDCVESLRELRLLHMRREKSKGIVRRILRR